MLQFISLAPSASPGHGWGGRGCTQSSPAAQVCHMEVTLHWFRGVGRCGASRWHRQHPLGTTRSQTMSGSVRVPLPFGGSTHSGKPHLSFTFRGGGNGAWRAVTDAAMVLRAPHPHPLEVRAGFLSCDMGCMTSQGCRLQASMVSEPPQHCT